MTTPIPASPIPQTPPKIGTRYVSVNKNGGTMVGWATSWAWKEKEYALRESRHEENADIYALLDPADAAELQRLRKVEESAADRHIEDANLGTPEQASASFAPWVKVRDERIAFEKKIGGGT
jgi:hypothetical protein